MAEMLAGIEGVAELDEDEEWTEKGVANGEGPVAKLEEENDCED